MLARSKWGWAAMVGQVLVFGIGRAGGVDKLVTADANLSTLVTADNTTLRWTGNYTVTVDAAVAFTVSGIDAGSFIAILDFANANRKIILGNTGGNIVVQASGGEVRVTGAGTGVRTAGFVISPSLTNQTVEVRTAVDDATNANYWIIGNHRLLTNGTSPQVRYVDLGADGGSAKLDVDESTTVFNVLVTGDLTFDIAAGKALTWSDGATALAVGSNTLTVMGGGSSAQFLTGDRINLDNAASVLSVAGTVTIDDVDLGASAAIRLADGAALTLTDAVAIGANTLTLSGTTGTSTETITATGGFTINNANSLITVNGDASHPLVISKVDITGADLNAGKGLDVDQSATVTALTVSQNATLDVAAGKTLGGTVTLNAAKTITLNNTGTVSAITTSTAAGTLLFSAAGTVTTLTNGVGGTLIDVNESGTLSALTMTENATVDVAAGKTLSGNVVVPASRILSFIGPGTLGTVTLNGTAAELNTLTTAGTVSNLNVEVSGGVLDVDVASTITNCGLKSGSGNLTLENANLVVTSTGGFDVNNNRLTLAQGGGTIGLVTMDSSGGVLDVNETTTITALSVSSSVTAEVADTKLLTTTATVAGGGTLKCSEPGTLTTVALNGGGATLQMTAAGTVQTVNVTADGGVLDIDAGCTLTAVNQAAGVGNLTLDVDGTKSLSSVIDVNDNTLNIINSGGPGNLRLDTAGGILEIDANVTVNTLTVTEDAAIDVAASTTLNGTVSILTKKLTVSGGGTLSRVEASTGSVVCHGTTTISDLRVSFGSGGTFTWDGSGNCTVTSASSSTVGTGARLVKNGTGTLNWIGGFDGIFSAAASVALDINGGTFVNGTRSASNDITFNDDGDEITLASGATFTGYGSFGVTHGAANVNFDAEDGSTINLSSTGSETLTAAADDDFRLLGQVNVNGTNGVYTLQGPHVFRFGDVTVAGTASLINETGSSEMLFLPDAAVSLLGSGTGGGALEVDGQGAATRITMSTTTAGKPFVIDRGDSDNLLVKNVALANSTYTSTDRGAAVDELALSGVVDNGDNINWFSPAVVDDEPEDSDDGQDTDDGIDDDAGSDAGDGADGVVVLTGEPDTVDGEGFAAASVVSGVSGASGYVQVTGATAGSVVMAVAEGNVRADFSGIPEGGALPLTWRVTSSVTGPFTGVVRLCFTEETLAASGLSASELVPYVFLEPEGPWVLAGVEGRYVGEAAPTETVGDYGYDPRSGCVWVVRDAFSDFAVGVGPTDGGSVEDEDDGMVTGTPPAATPRLCGLLGFFPMFVVTAGVVSLRAGRRRAGYTASPRLR